MMRVIRSFGHFAPLVDLGDSRCSRAMVHGQLFDCVAATVRAGYKLPPESLFHGSKLAA